MKPVYLPCRPLPLFAALLSLSLVPALCPAQTAPPASPPKPTSPTPKSSASKSPNVLTGVIVSFDATAETLTLKERAGKTNAYELTAKTHYLKAKHAAQPTDFKAGDVVVLHVRKSRSDDSKKVVELTDTASWKWLTESRRKTTTGKLTDIGEETITLTPTLDPTPITYTVSDKTKWTKGGKDTSVTEFKVGDTITVVPRSLPSGAIMARVVADSPAGAAQMKERQARTVHGVVQTIEAVSHKITLKTAANDTRAFLYNDTTEVRQNSKPLSQTALKAGLHVAIRLKRDVAGEEVATRITLESAKKDSSSKSAKK